MTDLSGALSGRVRWGVIGTGFMARNRIVPAIRSTDDGELVGVASADPERAKAFAAGLEIPTAYHSVAEMLASNDIDAVYVGTRNDEHCSQVLAAAAAAKHVLCEKPVALSLDDALAMHRACQAAGVVFAVNHYHRLKPSHTAIRLLIEAGELGTVLAAQITFGIQLAPEQRTWRLNDAAAGGGVALDLTVHEADIVRAMFASDVAEVVAESAKADAGAGSLDDSLAGVMRLRSGLLVSLLDSFVVPNPVHRLVVLGTSASVLADSIMRSDSDGTVTLQRGSSVEQVDLPRWRNPFQVSINMFNDAVRGVGRPAVSGLDGIKALAVALAFAESARTGRRVAVPDVEALIDRSEPSSLATRSERVSA